MNKNLFKNNECYKLLETKLTNQRISILNEIRPYIDMVEDYINLQDEYHLIDTSIDVIHPNDDARKGEVMICLNHNTDIKNIFEFPVKGITIKTFEYPDYWIAYYFYDNKQWEARNLISLIPKESIPINTFSALNEVIELCINETNLTTLGKGDRTINILRTPPSCSWYRHRDVMNPKIILPLQCDNGYFRWFPNRDADMKDFYCEMKLTEGALHMVNTHIWHNTMNESKDSIRWNLTLEEDYHNPSLSTVLDY